MGKFKIGDRVKRKNYGHGNFDVGDIGVVAAVSGDDISLKGDRDGFTHRVENLEPASLTIEAGKFYKTRDGRKVWPIKSVDDYFFFDGWHYGTDGHCGYKGGDTLLFKDRDLIAEWVDKPAVAVAASNDNAAPAKPAKFKVGDVVRFRDDYASSAAGNKATVIAVNVWGADGIQVDQGGYDGVSTEAEKDLELVVVATKFKVGDRIKGSAPGIGPVTGAIVEVDAADDDMTYFVLPDGNEYPFWVYNNTVEPADPAIPAIVALIEDGQPKPATRPYVHATEAAAANEADRLADLHKGQEFAVFVLTSSRKRAAPAYAFEWQRLAAKGEKIAAIKELRAVTGLPLRQSKDVVEHFVDSPYGEIAA